MWRICICSSTISEGSWRVGAVAWASCPELLMDTWKYRVPFSSHCCRQWTSEMSAAVPDISARQEPRRWVSGGPGLGTPGRRGETHVWELQRHLLCAGCLSQHQIYKPESLCFAPETHNMANWLYTNIKEKNKKKSMSQRLSLSFKGESACSKVIPEQQSGRSRI